MTLAPGDLVQFILSGLGVTVLITVVALVIALLVGLLVGLARLSGHRVIRWPAAAFVELFRGTSELVQMFWVFFALPLLTGYQLAPVAAACIVLGVNHGSYVSEIVRSALLAVPRAQREAIVALNLPPWAAFTRVILPQAVPRMLPPLGNQGVDLLKATSIVSLITVADMTFRAHQIRTLTGQTIESFLVILVLYFALSSLIGFVVKRLQGRFSIGADRVAQPRTPAQVAS
jgi:polar amino acid transport system permease protein